jgi:uncharacterized protein (TIGR02611 family)
MGRTDKWGDEQAERDASDAVAEAIAEGGDADSIRGETRSLWYFIRRSGKRIAVAIGGPLLLVAGIAMLALPGPGWLAIFAGLALLATEFAWAERLLHKAKAKAEAAKDAVMGKKAERQRKKIEKAQHKAEHDDNG